MDSKSKIQLFFLTTLFLFTLTFVNAQTLGTYIVQLHPHGTTSSAFTSKLKWHLSFIQQTLSSDEDPSSRLLYSYRSAMDGFAAQLSESEVEYLKNLPDVISIRPDRMLQIQTTYSYKFLGLNPARENGWYQSGFGRGTIIGVLDTGVWPESPSFNDQGMPPVPKKWKVHMGNGQRLYGESMYPLNHPMSKGKELELVYLSEGDTESQFCLRGSLPRDKVKGKMVVCDRGVNGRAEKGQVVKEAGGVAMILTNTEINLGEDSVDVHVLPASLVGFDEAVTLKDYINSTRRPLARIEFGGTVIGKSRAPAVARFSARGPTEATDHTGRPILDESQPAGVFDMGAGHVNPQRALNPGLVYDIRPDDYIIHLCSLGYTRSEIFSITHRNVSCNAVMKMNRGFSLNYPSFSVIFKDGERRKMFRRRLTNVGSANSIYSVEVMAPEGVKVIVKPKRLVFKQVNQSLTYRVWFISRKRVKRGDGLVTYAEGNLTWVHSQNGFNRVRSPVAVTWKSK
ncbi:hypothetical protein ACSQ67_001453 [Phaseolus vulgaris]